MDKDNTQKLAERIALLLQGNEADDFTFVRSSLEKINERLNKIENNLNLQSSYNSQSAIGNRQSFHPSQEKFQIAEGVAPELIKPFETEKPCPYEPTGKPCDHCSMCNSRGF